MKARKQAAYTGIPALRESRNGQNPIGANGHKRGFFHVSLKPFRVSGIINVFDNEIFCKQLNIERMKKLLIALVAMIITTGAFAQNQGGQNGPRQRREFNPEEMATRRADRIKETCTLTDEQYKKVKEYYTEQGKAQQEQMKKMMESGQQGQQMDREAMMKEMEARRAAETKAIKEILTEEQFAKYEKAQKEMRPRGGQGGPRGGQGGPEGGPQGGPENGPQGGPQGAGE